ncbi:hypothetical protein RZO50_11210 [Microbacterium sp. SSW1-59]|uniref:hypothetical protein n=1 Tax=Microbacterium xanthum TaxID=3079794 RepID=UPI002AD3DAD7|nr:hypothetical protein [Microbacterium sp. SSW1-59]MDZ8202085.1 hypothetical protein [Microbacterium sp. SSW1-59]
MIDIGYIVAPLAGVYVVALVIAVAKVLNLKSLIAVWTAHLEMRATARAMRASGASDKAVARFLADHSLARAGQSP